MSILMAYRCLFLTKKIMEVGGVGGAFIRPEKKTCVSGDVPDPVSRQPVLKLFSDFCL